MDSYLSNNQNCANSYDAPPVLIVADTREGISRAKATVTMAGLRVADAVEVDGAEVRVERQGAASAVWFELDRDIGAATARVLDQIDACAREGRLGAVIAIRADAIDSVADHALHPNIDVLVDSDLAERAAALAVVIARRSDSFRVNEATSDKNAARLRQLSDEVSRIAATLARLSTGPNASARPFETDVRNDAPPVSVETVAAVIRARRFRNRFFRDDLFADPAWDMLLDLLQAEIANHRVPVSSLCIAAAVPATTALRWLKTMVQEELFVRRSDPHDGRRVFVELAPQTSQALRSYFAQVGQVAVI